jgi:medium-chain acyl-[acyl-carrier-protein] hydrolase
MKAPERGANVWLSPRWPNPSASVRLFCFPYAGAGGAAFRAWRAALPAHIEVCPIELPGRWSRISEPTIASAPILVEQLVRDLGPVLDGRFALLGCSVGAIVAFELARALRRRGGPQPEHLFALARRAPHLRPVVNHAPVAGIADLTEFVTAIHQRYGGIPQQVFANRELLDVFAPALRADVALLETYGYTDEPALACPITAIAGKEDTSTPADDLQAWSMHTSARADIAVWDGGHFFFDTNMSQLQQLVASKLPQRRP